MGRAAELDWIRQRLRAGDGRGVVVAGEPGRGRSRLIAECVRAEGGGRPASGRKGAEFPPPGGHCDGGVPRRGITGAFASSR